MKNIKLKIKKLENGKDLPTIKYQTEGSAGLDLYAAEDIVIDGINIQLDRCDTPDNRNGVMIDQKLISTGICIEIPNGYYATITSRSGMSVKNKVVNGIVGATIDNDYRGELKVLLRNFSDESFIIKRGDRIAQLVILPYLKAEVEEVTEFQETTERGDGGFGSTGVK